MATQKSDPVTDTLSVIEDSEDDFANFDWTGAEVIHSPWADKVSMQSSLLVHEVPTPLPVDEVPTALPVEEPVPKRQRQSTAPTNQLTQRCRPHDDNLQDHCDKSTSSKF